MSKVNLWRGSLAASVCINALALGYVGSSRLLHPAPAPRENTPPQVTKPRLVEIEDLKTEKAAQAKAARSETDDQQAGQETDGENGKGDASDGSDDGDRSSAKSSPSGQRHALGKSPYAKALARKEALARQEEDSGPRKLAIRSDKTVNAKIELTVPKPRVVKGVNGVIDLSKAHINMELHADPSKIPANQKPNKVIGKNHVDIVKNGAQLDAKCVGSIGGNTVYASNLKIIYGPNVKITGTKYCAPGTGGLPGNNNGSSSSQQSDMSNGQGGNGAALPYHPKMIEALQGGGQGSANSGKPGVGGGGGKAGAKGQGTGGDSKGTGTGNGNGSGQARAGGQGTGGSGGGQPSSQGGISIGSPNGTIDSSQDPGQAALAAKHAAYARGPLRGLDDQKFHNVGIGLDTGPGQYDVAERALHLPESHGAPGDRLVSGSPNGSEKAHGKSAAQSTEHTRFNPAPVSVGSHSERGTVPWGPDSDKKPRENGLEGAYYTGRDFQQYHFTRRDKNLDFTWTGDRVDPRLPMGQAFSVRWTGYLKPRYSEPYTLYVTSDDGVRFWIDGKLILDNWTIHPPTEDVVRIDLVADREYAIKIEYFEQTGLTLEVLKLYWESPSQHKEYVPAKCLFPMKK